MILYIGILFVALIVAINDIGKKRKAVLTIGGKSLLDEKVMLSALLLYIFMFILTAFRAESVGKDTAAYIRIFKNVIKNGSAFSNTSRIEIGFKYLCTVIGHFFDNPQALIITSAIICYSLTGIFLFSATDHNGIMVALFSAMMFRNYCSGIRQAIALSICLIAYMMIKKERYYFGALLIAIAATFHTTALISLFYFVIPMAMKNKRFKYAILGLIIVAGFAVRYFGLMSTFDEYSTYYEGYYNEVGRAKIGILSCMLTMAVAIYIFISYIVVKNKTCDINTELNYDETLWFGIVILAIGILNFFSNNASRLMWYFELPFLASLTNRTSYLRPIERQRILLPILVLYEFVFIINLILRPYYFALVPYRFWGM